MSKVLIRNTIYFTIASALQKVIAFVYFAAITKTLTVEETGTYFLVTSIILILTVLEDIGLNSVLIREVAKDHGKASEWVRNTLAWKLITVPFTIGVAALLPILLGYTAEVRSLILLGSIILIADTISLTFYGAIRGLRRLKFESIGIFTSQLVIAIAGGFALYTGNATVAILIIALGAGSVFNMLYSGMQMTKLIGLKSLLPHFSMGLRPVKVASAFFIAAIFNKVYSYIDTVLLGSMIGKEAVGLYSVPYKLTFSFQFIPLAFVAALYPSMSHASAEPEALKDQLLGSLKYMMLVAAPIVFGVWAIAEPAILLFSTEEFLVTVPVLRLMIFSLFLIFLDFPLGSLMNAIGKQSAKTAVTGVAVVLSITLNAALIPVLGIMAPAIAALISFSVMLIIDWLVVRKSVPIKEAQVFKVLSPFFIAGIAMAAVVSLLMLSIHFIITIPIGAFVFFAVLYLLGGLTKQDLISIKSLRS